MARTLRPIGKWRWPVLALVALIGVIGAVANTTPTDAQESAPPPQPGDAFASNIPTDAPIIGPSSGDPRQALAATNAERRDRRTAHAKHYDLGNGQITAIVTSRPQHYRDPHTGEWHDIDCTVTPSDSAAVVYENRSNTMHTRFSRVPTAGVVLGSTDGADFLTMWIDPRIEFQSEAGQTVADAPINADVPVAQGAVVHHRNSHASGDTRFSIGPGRVKLDVLFDAVPAGLAAGMRVVVGETLRLADGLTLLVDGRPVAEVGATAHTRGEMQIVNSAGAVVAVIHPPTIVDALGVADRSAHFVVTGTADGVRLELVGRGDFLLEAQRAFPVAYDPTVEILATIDTYIREDEPTTSFGGSTLLHVRGRQFAEGARALLKFPDINTSNFSQAITEARYHAYCESVGLTGSTYKMAVWTITDDWNENTTWNSFANAIGTALADVTITTEGWYTFASNDLTSHAESWRTNATARDRGLAMSYELNFDHEYNSVWRSADYSGTFFDPFFSVTYNDGGVGIDLHDDGELYRSFFPRTVNRGDTIQVFCDIRNSGTAPSGSFRVDFYASSNTTITTADYYLGSVNMSSIAGGGWADCNLNNGFIPTSIPFGSYYVGWIIDAGNAVTETNENNNTAYKTGYLLHVVAFSTRCGMMPSRSPESPTAQWWIVVGIVAALVVVRRRRWLGPTAS